MNCTHMRGYIRYHETHSGFELEHRMVARIAWGPRVRFPDNVHVHHMDGCRQHNCRQNLLILDAALHDARTQKRVRQ